MVKKSSAFIACAIVFVFTAATVCILTIAGYSLFMVNSGRLQNTQQEPQPTVAAGNYSRLDEIRGVFHNDALTDVTDETLLDGAAKGMAWGSGDVYSEFFTAEEFKSFQQEEEGSYVGIGVAVNVDQEDKLITAVTVYKGSPAEKGGMLPGDKIIIVNGEEVAGLSLEQTVKLVRGEAGTEVVITVLRGSDQVELKMTRAEVIMNRTEWAMLDNGMGYIKILEFNGNAATLFDKAIKELKAQGMKGLILDLRNNPGGSLDVVAPIADELFPAGPIITMVDRDGKEVPRSRIMSDNGYLNLPMVVLVNKNSASASELLSGGIQDYKVGKLIGVTTYGKGVAQSFRQLKDGTWLKYTSNKYLTGGGRCPQDTGFTPDVVVELDDAAKENPTIYSQTPPTSVDNQFMRAVNELAKMMQGQ